MSAGPVEVLGPGSWTDKLTYVPAVRIGDMVMISGTTATGPDHKLVCPGDIVGQTRRIFEKFEEILGSLGGSCKNIVSTVDYYVTEENYPATAAVRREFLGTVRTAATGVQIAGLLRPGALIEISAVAYLPQRTAPAVQPAAAGRDAVDTAQLFAVIRHDRAGADASIRQRLRDEHRAFVATLGAAVKGGGPLVADDGATPIGGMMLIEAADRASLEAWIARDPYQLAGLFDAPQILAWNRHRQAKQKTSPVDASPAAGETSGTAT